MLPTDTNPWWKGVNQEGISIMILMKGGTVVAGRPRWVCCREVATTEHQSSAGFRFLPVGKCSRGVRPGSREPWLPWSQPQPFSSRLSQGTSPGISQAVWPHLSGDHAIKQNQLSTSSDFLRSEDKEFYLNLNIVFVIVRYAMLTMDLVKMLKRAKHTN